MLSYKHNTFNQNPISFHEIDGNAVDKKHCRWRTFAPLHCLELDKKSQQILHMRICSYHMHRSWPFLVAKQLQNARFRNKVLLHVFKMGINCLYTVKILIDCLLNILLPALIDRLYTIRIPRNLALFFHGKY